MKKLFYLILLFPVIICAQSFDVFSSLAKPDMPVALSVKFDELIARKVYYVESITTTSSSSRVSINKVIIWVKKRIVLQSTCFGELSNYDPSTDTISTMPFDDNAIVTTPDGRFAPLKSSIGTHNDMFNRVFVKNPTYGNEIFENMQLVTLQSVKYLLQKFANDELRAEDKKDYINMAIANEHLKSIHKFIDSGKSEDSLTLGDDKITYKLNDANYVEDFSLINESKNYWASVKNVYIRDEAEIPILSVKLHDFLLTPFPAQYDKRYYGFQIVKNGSKWIMKKRDLDWAQYLYSSNIMSDFFKNTIFKINGNIVDETSDIEKLIGEKDSVEITINLPEGEKSFNFKTIGEKERYILNVSKALNFSPDIYFK